MSSTLASAPAPVGAQARPDQPLLPHVNEDVLRAVFRYAFPVNPALMMVCKSWANVLLDSPELWTLIDRPSKLSFFQRSKQLPLDVIGVKVGPDAMWSAAIENRSRVRRLALSMNAESERFLAPYAPDGRVPDRLECLSLSACRTRQYDPEVPRWTTSKGLRSLRIVDMHVFSLDLFNPHRLTVLDISGIIKAPLTVAHVWAHISLCRRLRRLRLCSFADLGEWPPALSVVESLRAVHVDCHEHDLLPAAFKVLPCTLKMLRASVDDLSQPAFDAFLNHVVRVIKDYNGAVKVTLLTRAGPEDHVQQYNVIVTDLEGTFQASLAWLCPHENLPTCLWMLIQYADRLDVQDVAFYAFALLVRRLSDEGPHPPDLPSPCMRKLTVLGIGAIPPGSKQGAVWEFEPTALGAAQKKLFPLLCQLELKHADSLCVDSAQVLHLLGILDESWLDL